MTKRIALIGSGPTATYALKHLTEQPGALTIEIFEAGSEAGPGMPYSRRSNSPEMLANIASVEIPLLTQTLVDWLSGLSPTRREKLGIGDAPISERAFYPRIAIGAYFADEFAALCAAAEARGHIVHVRTGHRVRDIVPRVRDYVLKVETAEGALRVRSDAVVLATGHRHKKATRPAGPLYRSPYPTRQLRLGAERSAVILGSSLSAIDAVVALAHTYGRFDGRGARTTYHPGPGAPIRLVMASRKGLLPEADFYYPLPEAPLEIFSDAAIGRLIAGGKTGLLAAAMRLFRAQLKSDDPEYFSSLGLKRTTPESFARAYFARRATREPFATAAADLAEARRHHRCRHVVMWRYTLMRAHEAFASLVPYFDNSDLARFHKTLKPVFADLYGCVPHVSIARLLALHRAGCLDLVALGDRGRVTHHRGGFRLAGLASRSDRFETLVDARGQQAMTVSELGFSRLAEAMLESDPYRKNARTRPANTYRLPLKPRVCRDVFCLALPVMLKRYPFAQGLVSSNAFGQAVAQALLAETLPPGRGTPHALPGDRKPLAPTA